MRRHVFGVVLAMAAGVALFLAAGWGVAEITSLHARGMIGGAAVFQCAADQGCDCGWRGLELRHGSPG